MPPTVLGLDIGGANLKAATADKRAVSVPFPLWKQPDKLPAALASLFAQFPDAEEFAVTMTGELCDCYRTKRDGVNDILTSVLKASRCYPVRVWSTAGKFLTTEEARQDHLGVAAANWHALATFAGAYVPRGTALLVDIGSTTADLIPILDGEPWAVGTTDVDRMKSSELVYTGVRRTPVCSLLSAGRVAAEFFAGTLDAYLLLGHIPEDPADTDTADGRPATKVDAHARMSRLLCGDPELISAQQTLSIAELVYDIQRDLLRAPVEALLNRVKRLQHESLGTDRVAITSGSGEFLARQMLDKYSREFTDFISLTDRLGPALATCAPAYALAVLATERRP
ncbi:hydantoinase/oxoprolinase family protein [Fimbriiglobus ruber]|uniref:COG1548 family protein n=1 Tax=Fimbriiglobus ruber TaxID=1908690 RepID=A0A225DVN7_9BACT|nr:hydantoinase/oxoprolinase family protein [Fimbriiglobus ruber]OWK43674.1 COG1548 family protein [Fimbriiglobus ruber]